MIKRRISLVELIKFLGEDCIAVLGEQNNRFIDNLADSTHVSNTTLDWVNPSKDNKQEIVYNSKASVILVDPSIIYTNDIRSQNKTLIVVKNPKVALSKIGNFFFVVKHAPGIHPSTVISPQAQIGNNVYIGPFCEIGECVIGDGCVIESNIKIYNNVQLGRNCIVKSGAILGGEGFGFERDENGNLFRFPQIGGLVIGDCVEVGSNTCIDRGALSDTIIGDYTKINNLCHIAHNNMIGKNVVVTGCVNISGSNVIDDEVWIAPNSSIVGYVHIGQGCTIGMGAVVTKDVPAGETWVGNPAKKIERHG